METTRKQISARGFTLIELMVSTAILATVLVTLYSVLSKTTDAMLAAALQTELDMKAALICDEISGEIRNGMNDPTTLIIPATNDSCNFRQSLQTTGAALSGSNLNNMPQTNATIQYIAVAKSSTEYWLQCNVDSGSGFVLDHVLTTQLTPHTTSPIYIPFGFQVAQIAGTNRIQIKIMIQQENPARKRANPAATNPAVYTQYGIATTIVQLHN